MTDIIEQDALANSPDTGDAVGHDHTHEAVKSIVLTPRMDQTMLEWFKSLIKSELRPFQVVQKDGTGKRLMITITSNSYEDREGETITSKALEDYEASCFPTDDGLFHSDNPLLWWHDDDVVMGKTIAVNYSTPFLVEVHEELDTPISKALFDEAEEIGEAAGVSHRFGYLEKDRDSDGTFHRIFKQETSWLPSRKLAANSGTYAGVLKSMATPQSDAHLDTILKKRLGIEDASKKIHARTGEIEKEFAALGLQHKAAKPPFPPKDGAAAMADEAVADMAEDGIEEDAKETASVASLEQAMTIMNQIMGLVMQLVDAQGTFATEGAMMKMFKDMETAMAEQNTVEKASKDTLQQQLKALSDKVEALEKRLSQTPKSVQHERGQTPQELETSTNALANTLKKLGTGEKQIHPIFGVEYDPSKLPDYSKKE